MNTCINMGKNFTLITLLLLLSFSPVFSQETGHARGMTREMQGDKYHEYLQKCSHYKLRTLANVYYKKGSFTKAEMAYECLCKKFPDKVNKQDAECFYACLLKSDRIDEIPYVGLEKYDAELKNLIHIAKVRREVRDDKGICFKKQFSQIVSQSKMHFGYNIHDGKKISLFHEKAEQIYLHELHEREYKEDVELSFNKSKKEIVVASEKYGENTYLNTVYNFNIGLYQIDIEGVGLPKFPFNSRKYSVSMPFFSEKEKCLFFCSDNPKGYGGWDIYRSHLVKNKWQKPVLLDERINSVLDDIFPVVYGDYLLFNSDGRRGKGKLDVFAYNMKENVGYNLFDCNTALDDYCLRIVNDSVNFVICRDAKIMHGKFYDFWDRKVEESEIGKHLLRQDSLIVSKLAELDKQEEVVVNNDLATVKFPEVFSFYCGAPIYFPYNGDTFDQSFCDCVNECLSYFSQEVHAKNIMVFGSADPRGRDAYNSLLSLNRAKNVITYAKSQAKKDFNYVTIALGEKLFNKDGIKNIDDYREVFLRASNFDMPYKTMIAVRKDQYKSLKSVANCFNNDPVLLDKLNELMFENGFEPVYFVGIQGFYKVKKGDNLYRIGLKYSCSVADLMKVNQKKGYRLNIGELLILPMPEK
ncbi:hypothetical protein DF185_09395 [Marinifilum breve]|uniref:LysM domain-containing protein n=1 Tax=Marinifilum breve TaxID=2184082 RepID=A0A2V3ZYV2_9BACT|nr:LysM peptidoglycan-binding domain-containing protein [Marinifilum breve]PXY01672.1 hypothetical protein DF185_09395 [Marinifilum breve]